LGNRNTVGAGDRYGLLTAFDGSVGAPSRRGAARAPIFHGDSVARHRRLWKATIRALEAMPEASSKRESRVSLQEYSVAIAPSAHRLHAAAGGSVIYGG